MMLIKEENFRNLYKSHIIIKDENFAQRIARSLQIDSVWEDDLSDEELKGKMVSIEIDERINSIFAIPYIDHTAGMSFFILSTAHLSGKDVNICKRQDFQALSNTRKNSVNDFEFEYLENLNVNADFDLDYYAEFSKIVDNYYVNDGVEMLRFVDILDESRNEDYPDDLNVFFIKEGLQMERMWVRCENVDDDQLIEATLLNTPYQDFGIKSGDQVKVFPYKPQDSDEWIVICDLKSHE